MVDLIKVAEEAFATGKEFPAFRPGDTITVAYKIVEGNKERIQMFRGIVIKISGHLNQRRFTVRKMSGTVISFSEVHSAFAPNSFISSKVIFIYGRDATSPSSFRTMPPLSCGAIMSNAEIYCELTLAGSEITPPRMFPPPTFSGGKPSFPM